MRDTLTLLLKKHFLISLYLQHFISTAFLGYDKIGNKEEFMLIIKFFGDCVPGREIAYVLVPWSFDILNYLIMQRVSAVTSHLNIGRDLNNNNYCCVPVHSRIYFATQLFQKYIWMDKDNQMI